MQAYFISLLTTALVGILIGMLCPDGGIAKHVRLLSSLVLICVLISPLKGAIEALQNFVESGFDLPIEDGAQNENPKDQFQEATDEASKRYFTQMLTETLENEFSMPTGTVRCAVSWKKNGDSLSPTRVTVLLSGSSIWKNPHEIEKFVTTLLECECVTAIE